MWLGSIRPRSQCVGGLLLVQWCHKHVLNCLTGHPCEPMGAVFAGRCAGSPSPLPAFSPVTYPQPMICSVLSHACKTQSPEGPAQRAAIGTAHVGAEAGGGGDLVRAPSNTHRPQEVPEVVLLRRRARGGGRRRRARAGGGRSRTLNCMKYGSARERMSNFGSSCNGRGRLAESAEGEQALCHGLLVIKCQGMYICNIPWRPITIAASEVAGSRRAVQRAGQGRWTACRARA